jgi:hypothetical protein
MLRWVECDLWDHIGRWQRTILEEIINGTNGAYDTKQHERFKAFNGYNLWQI